MTLSGLTVSVDYADLLAKSLPLWFQGCDKLLVVTTARDKATIDLCSNYDGILVHITDAFYRYGAVFNKGLAISEAIEVFDYLDDWMLLFDADVIPTQGWRGIVETSGIQPGNLYGARRVMEDGTGNPHDNWELPGYFQLFHATDQNVQRRPLMDCSWIHAGGFDSEFQARWTREHKHRLSLTLTHQGQHGRNWFGRFNTQQMDKLLEDRRKVGRLADYERLP